MRLNFDLETNGLLDLEDLRVHCMSVIDVDTGVERSFVNHQYRAPSDGRIEEGIELLAQATELSGHNIVTFDLPVLKRLYGWEPGEEQGLYDTYIAAMLACPDVADKDYRNRDRAKRLGTDPMPGNLIGRHSLAAWGYRLGIHKGQYGQNRTDWSTFDLDMLRYCVQDVRVCVALRKFLEEKHVAPAALTREQKFAVVMSKQEQRGFYFDQEAAEELLGTLRTERAEIADELQELFPPKIVRWKTKVKKLEREKEVPFNPGSRQQIADRLIEKYGWEPVDFTDSGLVKVDETVLASLPYPEAGKLARAMLLNKRISQISGGRQAWLKKVKDDGRIHGRVINIGTPHGRCAHTGPNMAQVPGGGKPFGLECRALFKATPGDWVMVGADASGAQLRALAHYLAPLDDGHYVRVVTEGDPHSENQKAAGLDERFKAKVFIYAFLFGAGNPKLGGMIDPDSTNPGAVGQRVRSRFLKRTAGIAALQRGIGNAVKSRGHLISLGDRFVPVPSEHKGLNYLLTSFEVDIMKEATVLLHDRAPDHGLVWGVNYANLAHVHDEYQFEVRPDLADTLGNLAVQCIRDAGELLGSRCPMDGEYKIGASWADTH